MQFSHTTTIVIVDRQVIAAAYVMRICGFAFVVLHCHARARGGAQLQLANLLPRGFAARHAVQTPIPY